MDIVVTYANVQEKALAEKLIAEELRKRRANYLVKFGDHESRWFGALVSTQHNAMVVTVEDPVVAVEVQKAVDKQVEEFREKRRHNPFPRKILKV